MKFLKSRAEEYRAQGVAIVGMAGRFPGASTVKEFWENLAAGVESIQFATDEELREAGVDAATMADPGYVRASGSLREPEFFDAAFFGFSNREAEIVDPQQRVFLECAWEALEDAACDPDSFAGPIGVFAGAGMNTYAMRNILSRPDVIASAGEYQVMVGNDKDFLCSRIAYKLNLTGPAVGVQTACSTSLVAVQMAFESLLRGECDAALAGGVSIPVPQAQGYRYVPGMILSRDGHCRAFDAEASGTVPGAGAGVVVLKRLADALAAGDHIYAVIKGAAINNDGSAKVGYSAPSVDGQSAVIRRSMEMAGFAPESVGYVEAHGTGTEVGDPIEFTALARVFEAASERKASCALGALKTNIGHLDTASGVAGLLKAALALKHRAVPPTLHFTMANPLVDFEATAFRVNTSLLPYVGSGPFRAGVSSFGIGGTNAHVSLEEAPLLASDAAQGAQIFALSAKSAAALDQRVGQLEGFLDANPSANLADVAFTLQVGRKPFHRRLAVVAGSVAELKAAFRSKTPREIRTANASADEAKVTFLFPGQGSQYVHMGLGLYETERVFRDTIDSCCEVLRRHLSLDLRKVLYPEAGGEAEATRLLTRTAITQPALFVVEYAMAKLWMSCGVQPSAMLGHSVGEFVAACLAGVFSLEDALALIAERGRLVQSMPPGAMLAVTLPLRDLEPMLSGGLSVAAINSETQTVASGEEDAITALEAGLLRRGIECRRLRTSHAFHSSMMEPIVAEFVARVAKVDLKPPTLRYLSNVTGTWATAAEATDPAYWGRHLRETVRFAECARQLRSGEEMAMLEVGPGEALLALMRGKAGAQERLMLASMRHPLAVEKDREFWLASAGRLWLHHAELDWKGFYTGQRRVKLSLPTYPFQRQRHYIEPGKVEPGKAEPSAISQKTGFERQADIADWFYAPSWRRGVADALPQQPAEATETWLVLSEDGPLMNALASGLGSAGQVVQVVPARESDGFRRTGEFRYSLDPANRADYVSLVRDLVAREMLPERVVHAFAAEIGSETPLGPAVDRSIYCATALLQAMEESGQCRQLEFNMICDRAYSVFGEAVSTPVAGALAAFMKAVPVELPHVTPRVIDVDMRTNFARTAQQVVAELRSRASGETVAYRGSTRWIESCEPVRLPHPDPEALRGVTLKLGGTYLITGGTGGIGLVLGEHIARTARATVVLTGRTALPPEHEWAALLEDAETPAELRTKVERVRAGIRAIEESGGKAVLLNADVSDTEAMLALMASVQQTDGPINGIIHAAGIAGAGMITTRTREQMQATLAAKVQGTEWIRESLDAQGLDFVMLCSSISALVPAFGLADYAAANAYLDGFAAMFDDPLGTRVMSVGWDTWREVGMAANAPIAEGLTALREQRIEHGILSHEAEKVFDRLLATPLTHLVVSTRPLSMLLDAVAEGIEESRSSVLAAQQASARSGPVLPVELDGAEDEVERIVMAIWRELLGVDAVRADDNFFELGGHSLLGTQVLARLQVNFGVTLPLRTIFEATTPTLLAQRVRLAAWASSVESMAPDFEREEIEF